MKHEYLEQMLFSLNLDCCMRGRKSSATPLAWTYEQRSEILVSKA
jgi:hypothetical protein